MTGQETEANRDWALARVKAITGEDTISARFMRQDFFSFKPQCKLVFAANHKPGLQTVDEAIRRRFNLIPFAVTIPPAERDDRLQDKLKAEWPGILAWAVQGCQDWQQQGLKPPVAVTDATEEYLREQNTFAAWLADTCHLPGQVVNDKVVPPNAFSAIADLYSSWKYWADSNGERAMSQRSFGQGLVNAGFKKATEQDRFMARGYIGLSLKSAQTIRVGNEVVKKTAN